MCSGAPGIPVLERGVLATPGSSGWNGIELSFPCLLALVKALCCPGLHHSLWEVGVGQHQGEGEDHCVSGTTFPQQLRDKNTPGPEHVTGSAGAGVSSGVAVLPRCQACSMDSHRWALVRDRIPLKVGTVPGAGGGLFTALCCWEQAETRENILSLP